MLPSTIIRVVCAGACLGWLTACARGADATDDATFGGSDAGDDTDAGTEDSGGGDVDDPSEDLDPGHVTLRRLNRVEYGNTLRDLFFGLDLGVAVDFPDDDSALGYDNIGDVMSVTPLLFDLYERATDEVLTAALVDPAHADIRAQIISCDPASDACVHDVLSAFMRRAWRRPIAEDELAAVIERVGATTQAGGTRDEGLLLALQQVLMSPHFVFRVELDADPGSNEPHDLTDHELATRLSYFMWSSMPDAALMAAADAGELRSPAEIEAQVRRMLADPRALALLDNFAGQWLGVRGLAELGDAAEHPGIDAELAAAMRAETEASIVRLFTGESSLVDLLTSDQGMVNDRLARLYGLPEPGSDALVPVSLAAVPRRGLFTQASMMALLSNQGRSSPTRRGKWILDKVLCSPPPSPPANVDNNLPQPGPGQTTRDVLEQLRENANCAGCHAVIDPIGLPFESYDATGAWRDQENGVDIDPSTEVGGVAYPDAIALLAGLVADSAPYQRCAAQQMLTYAVGRELGASDDAVLEALLEISEAADAHVPELLIGVAQSAAFRRRRGDPD